MPGGWMLSTTWAPMCGQAWFEAAACFLGMWLAMTVAMMSPSLLPRLWRYREALDRSGAVHADALTALAGSAYFAVWTAFGLGVFAGGAALVQGLLQHPLLARSVPFAAGVVVLTAGWLQCSPRKARLLADCHAIPECAGAARAAAAWHHGLRLGLHCARCCANLTAILLVAGVMNSSAMVVATIAISAERLAADGERIARWSGAAAVVAGAFLIAHAIGSA